MSEHASRADDTDVSVVARSFVVRALLEGDTTTGGPEARWHGFVTDTQTGLRSAWRRPSEVARFMDRLLVTEPARIAAQPAGARFALGGLAVAGPALTDVVTDMLAVLGERLPTPVPAVPAIPDPNVTLERVAEKLVGLGNQRGTDPTGPLGARTLRGGRLDARVRFQVWAGTAPAADAAMQTLHTTLLDDADELRAAGFLKLAAAGTTLAEPVDTIPAWRKATSFDVLYEYRYVDEDDAASLIARIPVTTDPEASGSPAREVGTVVDELVRWDEEVAPTLVVHGPAAVSRVAALTFVPGPPLGGTVTFRRTSGSGAPVTSFGDLDAFLAATSGDTPTHTDADVTLAPADAFTALGPAAPGPTLGDWDTDGTPDAYTGVDRRLDAPVRLAHPTDRFEIAYAPPPGPATGLDQTAVVYLRVNPP
ncbi:hypothetical protein DDP54_06960 [Cellulomonas sp. WB94]|uniref:hypothetical protein n=1 Tax=Cellulomonas sp. WB94 TaxID=2173174 RepID=UPI000D56B4A3|nr:hypothetical protein [Cellulomonas sp. WB94]PVU82793.1 hypothetical protein DDP54_06960 [Cellulomonas sp. WB94]